MSMNLPDVDEDSYRQYQADQFARSAQQRVQSLSFEHSAQQQIASLSSLGRPPEIAHAPSFAPTMPGQPQIPIPQPQLPQIPAPQLPPIPQPAMPQIPQIPQLPAFPSPAPIPAPAPPSQLPNQVVAPSPTRPALLPDTTPPRTPGSEPQIIENQPTVATPTWGTGGTQQPAWNPNLPSQQQQAPQGIGQGRQDFVDSLAPLAQQASQQTGIDPSVYLAIAANETGWGRSQTAQQQNNLFSIQGSGANGSRWAGYASPQESFDSFNQLISTAPRYAQAWADRGDPVKFVQDLRQAGYVVDEPGFPAQGWVDQVNSIRGDLSGSIPQARPQAQPQAQAQAQSIQDISQFGDPQLTSQEAYSACGPAAAVRFAQRFGRNPTLREATDLAKTVGWTSAQGMAGIGSEQQLMHQMGVETRIVGPGQMESAASEAQSGNPVTISTPGHYFYADGYNPQTGQYHVGRSGLDLIGGAEWMSPSQMQTLMGPIQGALLANNPTIQSQSTATSSPSFLDQQRQLFSDSFTQPTTTTTATPRAPAVRSLDQAITEVASQPTYKAAFQPAATTPTTAQPQQPGVAASAGNPLENLGSLIGNAIQGALQSALGLGGGPPGGPPRNDQQQQQQDDQRRQQLAQGLSPERLFRNPFGGDEDVISKVTGVYTRPPKDMQEAADRAMADVMRRGVPAPGPTGQLGFVQPGRSLRELNPLSKGPEGSALEEILSAVPGLLGGAHAAEEVNPLRSVAQDVARPSAIADAAQAPARMTPEVLQDFQRYASDLADSRNQPPLGSIERGGLAVRDPGYLAGTPERMAEDLASSEATNQGTLRPNLSADQISTLPGMQGATRDLNDFRAAAEAGLPFKNWYSDFSNWAMDLVGKDNLPEALSIFAHTSPNNPVPTNAAAMVSMMRAVRQSEREGAWDLGSVRKLYQDMGGGTDKFSIRAFGQQGAESNDTMKRIWQLVGPEGDKAFATRENVGKLMQGYLEGYIPQAANAKTSSYYENLVNSLSQVYDHFSTNDTWMGQIFGPKGSFKADNPLWYRSMYGLINRVSREMGLPPRDIQAAAWTAYRSLMDENLAKPPEVEAVASAVRGGKMSLAEGIKRASDSGYYRDMLRSGTEWSQQEHLPSALREVYQHPKFQEALGAARANNIDLKAPPPADVLRDITVEHPGAPKPGLAQTPFPVQQAERAAGQDFYRAHAPQVLLPSLEQAGYDPVTGQIPDLGVLHEVDANGSGATVRLPGGNADTVQYAAAKLGDRLNLPEVTVHLPNSDAPNTSGLSLDAPAGGFTARQATSIAQALDQAGAQYARASDGSFRVFDAQNEGQDWATRVVQNLGAADTRGGTLRAYAADTTRVAQTDYSRILGDLGDRYGSTGAPGVPRGALPDLATRSPQSAAAPYSGTAAADLLRARQLGGVNPQFATTLGGAAAGGGSTYAATDENDPNRGLKVALATLAGGLGAHVAGENLLRERALPGESIGSVLPEGTFGPLRDAETEAPLLARLKDSITKEAFDRGLPLNQIQEQARKLLGRDLRPDELVGLLQRLNPGGASHVTVDRGLGEPIRAVGQHYDSLRDYVTAKTNISTSLGLGKQTEAQLADRLIPTRISNALTQAERLVEQRQKAYDAVMRASTSSVGTPGMGIPRQMEINAAERALRSAEDMLGRRRGDADQARRIVLQQAAAEGGRVSLERKFSGGMDLKSSQDALKTLEQRLGPDLYGHIQANGDKVLGYANQLRDHLVDSGVMSRQQADELSSMYPDWAKTRILDYMNQDAEKGGQAAGTRLGLGDKGLQRYTIPGTERAREDPIASQIAHTDQVLRMSYKNRLANKLVDLDQEAGTNHLKQLISPSEYAQIEQAGGDVDRFVTKANPEDEVMTLFRNGEKRQYVTNNKLYSEAIKGAETYHTPAELNTLANFVRMTATARNPLFLAGNAALDVPEYYIRTAAQGGAKAALNPLEYGHMTAALMRSYRDAFSGITEGRFTGKATQRFLEQGGGMGGEFRAFAPEKAEERLAALKRSSVFEVNGPEDIKRMAAGLVKMRWVEGLGQRAELAPRVAAMQMAERRGQDWVRSTIAGRDVTVDFDRGGRFVKMLNQWIPFLNVGFQGSAQIKRLLTENPKGAAAAITALIGGPTVAAEAWNRSDPQRAKDYEDVPQYLKDSGIVLMLPTQAPVDKDGNRHPQYAYINMRNMAPFVQVARAAAERGLPLIPGGAITPPTHPRDWNALAGASILSSLPLQTRGPTDLADRLNPVPPLGTMSQLALNRDFYRGSSIVTDRSDENASPLAKTATPLLQAAVDRIHPQARIRPSAIDFAIKDELAGLGDVVLGASRLGEARDQQPQSIPALGGLLGRFVQGRTGESLQEARDQPMSNESYLTLRQHGVNWNPSAAPNEISKVPLTQAEQTQYQQLLNQYVDDTVKRVTALPSWQNTNDVAKEHYLQERTNEARDRAAAQVMATIPTKDKIARRKSGSAGSKG
jgi:flagellum-specific peptidoglycan hydrolase FlgJ